MLVLCAGDLHLGRRSSRLPASVDPAPLTCAHAWEALVERALARRVDVLALSGDLVDRANRFFEAIGPLERGIRRLAAAGIVTVAVAGNHDHDVLPELARVLPADAFRFLGAGGRWERTTIVRRGERLHVDGWSFPAEHVRECPLDAYPRTGGDGAPVLGLLHADLDAAGSAYAPVARAALQCCPVSAWLLGHVHAPALHAAGDGAPAVLYPGSLQAMDPGEPGAHGAWELELGPGVPAVPRPVPLSTVRYETLEVDVAPVGAPELLAAHLFDALRSQTAALCAHAGPLRHLVLRVRLTGRSALHRALDRSLAGLAEELAFAHGDLSVHVERVQAATRPVHDLEALARAADAPGLVARLVLDARRAGGTHPVDGPLGALLADAARAAGAVRQAPAYRALAADDTGLGAADLHALVERQATLLLDELLAQRAQA